MQFANFGITTIFENNKTLYQPVVKGKILHHIYETEEEAIIFAIAYSKSEDFDHARYATEFITKMLSE